MSDPFFIPKPGSEVDIARNIMSAPDVKVAIRNLLGDIRNVASQFGVSGGLITDAIDCTTPLKISLEELIQNEIEERFIESLICEREKRERARLRGVTDAHEPRPISDQLG